MYQWLRSVAPHRPWMVIGFVVVVGIYLQATESFARAGGGSSGGKGSIVLLILLGPSFLFYALYKSRLLNQKNAATRDALRSLAASQRTWDPNDLVDHVRETFVPIQKAWCSKDTSALALLLHPVLLRDWAHRIEKMQAKGKLMSWKNFA